MSEPEDLVDRIRQSIVAGRLPKEHCQATWYGKGTGQLCEACDRSITPDDIEVECDLRDGGVVRLHGRCYDVWSCEVSA